MVQIATPRVSPPDNIHIHELRASLSRMRWACVRAVNEPIIATRIDNTTNGIFQLIGIATLLT
jgi:hypothetical protein